MNFIPLFAYGYIGGHGESSYILALGERKLRAVPGTNELQYIVELTDERDVNVWNTDVQGGTGVQPSNSGIYAGLFESDEDWDLAVAVAAYRKHWQRPGYNNAVEYWQPRVSSDCGSNEKEYCILDSVHLYKGIEEQDEVLKPYFRLTAGDLHRRCRDLKLLKQGFFM